MDKVLRAAVEQVIGLEDLSLGTESAQERKGESDCPKRVDTLRSLEKCVASSSSRVENANANKELTEDKLNKRPSLLST